MSGVEASLRIRVQDFRARYPPFEQRNESLPPFAGTLTAACDYLIPQPVDALPEGAQLPEISGHRVVLVQVGSNCRTGVFDANQRPVADAGCGWTAWNCGTELA